MDVSLLLFYCIHASTHPPTYLQERSITYKKGWGETWNEVYNQSSASFGGREACDCYRWVDAWMRLSPYPSAQFTHPPTLLLPYETEKKATHPTSRIATTLTQRKPSVCPLLAGFSPHGKQPTHSSFLHPPIQTRAPRLLYWVVRQPSNPPTHPPSLPPLTHPFSQRPRHLLLLLLLLLSHPRLSPLPRWRLQRPPRLEREISLLIPPRSVPPTHLFLLLLLPTHPPTHSSPLSLPPAGSFLRDTLQPTHLLLNTGFWKEVGDKQLKDIAVAAQNLTSSSSSSSSSSSPIEVYWKTTTSRSEKMDWVSESSCCCFPFFSSFPPTHPPTHPPPTYNRWTTAARVLSFSLTVLKSSTRVSSRSASGKRSRHTKMKPPTMFLLSTRG